MKPRITFYINWLFSEKKIKQIPGYHLCTKHSSEYTWTDGTCHHISLKRIILLLAAKTPQQMYLVLEIKQTTKNPKQTTFFFFYSFGLQVMLRRNSQLRNSFSLNNILWLHEHFECRQRKYPFSYLSWMREARSSWLMWELLRPSRKDHHKSEIFRHSQNTSTWHSLLILWALLLPDVEQGNAETTTLPKPRNWGMYHNRLFLAMTQNLNVLKFI